MRMTCAMLIMAGTCGCCGPGGAREGDPPHGWVYNEAPTVSGMAGRWIAIDSDGLTGSVLTLQLLADGTGVFTDFHWGYKRPPHELLAGGSRWPIQWSVREDEPPGIDVQIGDGVLEGQAFRAFSNDRHVEMSATVPPWDSHVTFLRESFLETAIRERE